MLCRIFRFKSHFEPHSNREWTIKALQEFSVGYYKLWWASPERSKFKSSEAMVCQWKFDTFTWYRTFRYPDNTQLPISGTGLLSLVINIWMLVNSECRSDYYWQETLGKLQEQAKPVIPNYNIAEMWQKKNWVMWNGVPDAGWVGMMMRRPRA